jgi:hypothetical protein
MGTSDGSGSMARELMTEFADETGLSSERTPRRYLWTDAFAVCNFLELYRQTGEEQYRRLALRLVDQVHHTLGRHREDDPRSGWISGLDAREGEKHPTLGGLRIGKSMNERRPSDPFDERLEWDRDGQYYHYLTKWMHALNRVGRVMEDGTYNLWARELAKTAHSRFTYVPVSGGRKRLYWKMSIDLSYPLVPSMGQHDPLDGLITYHQLQETADREFNKLGGPNLHTEIAEMADICKGKTWVTDDPLGIGGLLCGAHKTALLIAHGSFTQTDLPATLLDAADAGLRSYAHQARVQLPADYRLAFRELGLAIGLRAVEKLRGLPGQNQGFSQGQHKQLRSRVASLLQYAPLGEAVERFWSESANRAADSWQAHRDINTVMLATGLAPDGFLAL